MRSPIIRINDVKDIDTSRISVYDMNNRYIDHSGNMYGLKFDRNTKKIKIIHLLRTLREESYAIQHQIIAKRLQSSINKEETIEENENPYVDLDNFDPILVLNEILSLMESHKERLKGIMMNIKNSNVFTKDNKEESIELDTIFRSIELDGLQQIDNVESYEKELSQYPRSLTYYQTKLDSTARRVVDRMMGDTVRIMNFIHAYEMSAALNILYTLLRETLSSLMNLLGKMDDVLAAKTNQFEIKSFEDSRISVTNTMIEIDAILEKLKPFEEYLRTVK